MNHAIIDAGGTVMQFVGDAVMAVFGAPMPLADHPGCALTAALSMHERQSDVNQRWETESLPPFALGIGLSTGDVAAVILGSDERIEYTMVGDTVNMAQRLQQFAEGGETVLSEATHAMLKKPVDVIALEPQTVKGRATPVRAYKLRDAVTPPVSRRRCAGASRVGRRLPRACAAAAGQLLLVEVGGCAAVLHIEGEVGDRVGRHEDDSGLRVRAVSRRVVSMPSMPPMLMSMRTRSGLSSSTRSSASSPDSASPISSNTSPARAPPSPLRGKALGRRPQALGQAFQPLSRVLQGQNRPRHGRGRRQWVVLPRPSASRSSTALTRRLS